MNLLIINPYDYKTVQSNPGLLSFLHVLTEDNIKFAITVIGAASSNDHHYIEIPEGLVDTENNNVNLLISRVNASDITHVIAIDPEGAMVAIRLLQSLNRGNIRCSYISYEILFSDEVISTREQKLKEYDLAFLSLCNVVCIQDEVRGAMFRKESGREIKQVFSPVSPHQYVGKGKNRDAIKNGLGLPLDKKILVYSGSLAPYAKPDWWIPIAELLPKNFIFLFTCFDGNQFNDKDLARIGNVLSRSGNAYFVRTELPTNHYMQVLQACDVGLALFRPVYTHWMNGRNIRQIGLSSGKFCNYVSCGLPVICDGNQDVFLKLSTNYPVVQTIMSPQEVPSKLNSLIGLGKETENYCSLLFNDVLNPCHGIRQFIDILT